jgi:hypothetical protein
MAVDEEPKVERAAERTAPESGESTTTLDAEPTTQADAGENAAKGQRGVRKHLIALSIVLCQLVVVCWRGAFRLR